MKTIKFGILGPGRIANRFTEAFQYVEGASVYSLASRDRLRAEEFAKKYGAEKIHSTYEDLMKDPHVDVIYIATPHPYHFEQTLLCLKHGKAVLCEKPLAMNYHQASEMIDTSQRTGTFLMEAMWSRFFPAIHKALELVRSGKIGEVKSLHADFGFVAPLDMENRVYKMALGGGAQLDVGVYPMFLALLVLGKPDEIKAFSQRAETGADTLTSALFYYKSGAVAHILSSIVTDSPKVATILGSNGRITIDAPWHKSQGLLLELNSGENVRFPFPHSGNGFEFQIEETVKCVLANKVESDLMPHRLSLLMAETSDEIRRQGGVRYDADTSP